MNKIVTGILLSIALSVPLAVQAQEHRDGDHQNKKYYDRAHKDYHEWNDNENTQYHQWQRDNHRKDHDWERANRREQQQYWSYRHEHGDDHR